MNTILAVYENGVLKPTTPLDLKEGQCVQLVVQDPPLPMSMCPSTPEEEDYERRLNAAKTIEELHEVMATCPPFPDEPYDIIAAINESRRLTGFRMPDPEPTEEPK